MMDQLWDAVLSHFESRLDYFRLFDRYRMRPDGWMKAELIKLLSERRQEVNDVRPDRQNCDVWFSNQEGEWWIAVRSILTNYAGGGREAGATIGAVEQVAREMDKLRGLATLSGGTPGLLLAAFPFGPHPMERREWASQLLRFEAKGFDPERKRVLAVGPEREAHVHLLV